MPRRRQSKFGATNPAMPFNFIRRRVALQASLARAGQRKKAKEDADCPANQLRAADFERFIEPDLPPVQLQRKTRPWIGRVHGSNPRHVL